MNTTQLSEEDDEQDDQPTPITDPIILEYLSRLKELNRQLFMASDVDTVDKTLIAPLLFASETLFSQSQTVEGLLAVDGILRIAFPAEYYDDFGGALDGLTGFPLSGLN